jgi:hypothetical protein
VRIASAEEFKRLRESEIPEEYEVAAHGEADEDVWMEVIERFPDLRKWVAHNKTVPLPILEILSVDPDVHVRQMVAVKRKLSSELFQRLAKDPCEAVRSSIAGNAKVPREILLQLADDESKWIREAVERHLSSRATEK